MLIARMIAVHMQLMNLKVSSKQYPTYVGNCACVATVTLTIVLKQIFFIEKQGSHIYLSDIYKLGLEKVAQLWKTLFNAVCHFV